MPLFGAVGVALALFAGTRAPGIDNDYAIYEDRFDCVTRSESTSDISCQVEPGFKLIAQGIHAVGYAAPALILLFAIAAIGIKLSVIAKLPDPILALLAYFPLWFFLHDMTQIRAGLACAILLVGMWRYSKGTRLGFAIWILLAASIHFSAILFLVLLALPREKHSRSLGVVLILASIAISYVNVEAILPTEIYSVIGLQDRLLAYVLDPYSAETAETSRFGLYKLMMLGIYLLGLLFYGRLSERYGRLFVLAMNAMLVGTCAFFVLYSVPAIAARTWQMFTTASVIVLPMILRLIPSQELRIVVACGIAAASAYYFIELSGILQPYQSLI